MIFKRVLNGIDTTAIKKKYLVPLLLTVKVPGKKIWLGIIGL